VADAFAKGAVAAVTTREHPAGTCIVVDNPLRALQQFSASHRERFCGPVIAITGSAGKTTTKDLTAAVLGTRMRVAKTEGNLNNDIGVPLTLLGIGEDTQAAIVEMGANHKGEIAQLCAIARPGESTITMIGEAHLEGFGSLDDVESAKGEIARALAPDGTFYVNADDARCLRVAKECRAKKVYVGREGDVAIRDCRIDADGEMRLMMSPVGELKLPLTIRAHATNVALAVAIGLQHGVSEFGPALREACLNARRFRVLTVGPLTVIDDSYNANPVSMRAAIDALAERPTGGARLAALGDMLELGAASAALHAEIGRYAAEAGVKRLYIRGAFARATADAALAAGLPLVEVIDAHETMAEAIAADAGEGDCLLVKGSRGMRMERVIERLRARYGVSLEAGATNGPR
jgi:UDP-N-acetylmuramoyl-tripeptide--D-alanyl-D-alanine ligase